MKLIFQTRQAVDTANRQIALDMGCDENTPYWYEVTEEVDGRYSLPCPDNLANLADYTVQDDDEQL